MAGEDIQFRIGADASKILGALQQIASTLDKTAARFNGLADRAEPAIKKTEGLLTGFIAKIFGAEAAGHVMGDVIVGVFERVKAGVEKVVMALPDLVQHTAEVGDHFLTLSRQTGISVESLSQWEYVAEQTSTSLETMSRVAQNMSLNLGNAGPAAATAIRGLHLSLDQLRKDEPDVAFQKVIEALHKLPTEFERSSAGNAIFGRQFRNMRQLVEEDMAGLMKKGDELGRTMTETAAIMGDRFTDAQNDIHSIFEGIKRTIGTALLPAATKLAEGIAGMLQNMFKGFSANMGQLSLLADRIATSVLHTMQRLSDAITPILQKLFTKNLNDNVIVDLIDRAGDLIVQWAPILIDWFTKIIGYIKDIIATVRAAWDLVPEWFKKIVAEAIPAAAAIGGVSMALKAVSGKSLLEIFAGVSNIISAGPVVVKAFDGLANAAKRMIVPALDAGMALGKMPGVMGALGKATEAVYTVLTAPKGIVAGLGEVIGSVLGTGASFVGLAAGPIAIFVGALAGLLLVIRGFTGSWDFITVPAKQLWGTFVDLKDIAKDLAQTFLPKLAEWVKNLGKNFHDAFPEVGAFFDGLKNLAKNIAQTLRETFPEIAAIVDKVRELRDLQKEKPQGNWLFSASDMRDMALFKEWATEARKRIDARAPLPKSPEVINNLGDSFKTDIGAIALSKGKDKRGAGGLTPEQAEEIKDIYAKMNEALTNIAMRGMDARLKIFDDETSRMREKLQGQPEKLNAIEAERAAERKLIIVTSERALADETLKIRQDMAVAEIAMLQGGLDAQKAAIDEALKNRVAQMRKDAGEKIRNSQEFQDREDAEYEKAAQDKLKLDRDYAEKRKQVAIELDFDMQASEIARSKVGLEQKLALLQNNLDKELALKRQLLKDEFGQTQQYQDEAADAAAKADAAMRDARLDAAKDDEQEIQSLYRESVTKRIELTETGFQKEIDLEQDRYGKSIIAQGQTGKITAGWLKEQAVLHEQNNERIARSYGKLTGDIKIDAAAMGVALRSALVNEANKQSGFLKEMLDENDKAFKATGKTFAVFNAAQIQAQRDRVAGTKAEVTGDIVWRDAIGQVAAAFEQLAQHSTGVLSGIAGLTSQIIDGFNAIQSQTMSIAGGLDQLSSGEKAKGFATLAVSILNVAQAVATFGKGMETATKSQIVMNDTMKGAQIGTQIMPGWGTLIGAGVGALIGALTTPQWVKAQRDVGNEMGVHISEGVALGLTQVEVNLQKLDSTLSHNTARHYAELLSLDKIIESTGGLNSANLSRWETQAGRLFEVIKHGGEVGAQGVAALGKLMDTFAAKAEAAGGLWDDAFKKLIVDSVKAGAGIENVTKLIQTQLDKLAGGTARIGADIVAAMNERFKKAAGMTVEDADAAIKELADLEKKAKDELNDGDQERLAALRKTVAAIKLHNAEIVANTQEEFDRVSRISLNSFNILRAQGKTIPEAISAIGPGIDDLTTAATRFGFEGNEALKSLQHWRELTVTFAPVLDEIGSLNDLMTASANLNGITQDSFNDMAAQGLSAYQQLLAAGFTEQEALQAVAPLLENEIKLHDEKKLKIDDATQALIDQANADGILKAKQISTNDILMEGLGAIIKALKGEIPAAWQEAADAAKRAAEETAGATQKQADDAVDATQGSTDAMVEIARKAAEAAAERARKTADELAKNPPVITPDVDSDKIDTAMNNIEGSLDATKHKLDGETQTAWEEMALKAKTEAAKAQEGMAKVQGSVETAAMALNIADWSTWADDVIEAARRAKDAVDALTFGTSPGGITDVIAHLDTAANAATLFANQAVGDMLRAKAQVDAVSKGLKGFPAPLKGLPLTVQTGFTSQARQQPTTIIHQDNRTTVSMVDEAGFKRIRANIARANTEHLERSGAARTLFMTRVINRE